MRAIRQLTTDPYRLKLPDRAGKSLPGCRSILELITQPRLESRNRARKGSQLGTEPSGQKLASSPAPLQGSTNNPCMQPDLSAPTGTPAGSLIGASSAILEPVVEQQVGELLQGQAPEAAGEVPAAAGQFTPFGSIPLADGSG